MKKIGLAAFVIVSFVVYSLYQRNENSALPAATSSALSDSNRTTAVTPSSSSATNTSTVSYKDGNYTGTAADAIYGYIKVEAVVSGGKLTDVKFLQYPNDRRDSIEINSQAMPLLKQQAIQVQTAQVDGVSGATDTSQAFMESLGNALQQARA